MRTHQVILANNRRIIMTNFTNYPTLMGHRTLYDFIVENRKKRDSGFPLSDMYVDDEGNSVIEMALAGYKKENIEIELGFSAEDPVTAMYF